MTDKEKIRKEVERLRNLHQMKYQQLDLDADSSLSLVECGKRNLCNELLSFIDSLQEEPVSEDLEAAANKYIKGNYSPWLYKAMFDCFKAGAEWQKGKTLSDVKKAVTGKMFQFSMDNVEVWGDDSNGNGKTIKLKGRVTFRVTNHESIIDALFAELK